MNLVIDTNIWISFLIGKALIGLKNLILDKKLNIITSEEQIKEIFNVLQRPKLQKYFSQKDMESLFFLIYKLSKIVNISHIIDDCRDKKDNFILEMAVNGKADFILTGDSDLLVLNPYKKIKIITYKEFEDLIFTNRYDVK